MSMSPIPQADIRSETDGFTLCRHGKPDETVRWEHVREIVAWRDDPQGRDLLCLGFRASAGRTYVEIHEEMPGYAELLEEMYEAFPKIQREWWQTITTGIGPNRTTIHGLPLATPPEPAGSAHARFLRAVSQGKKARRVLLQRGVAIFVGLALCSGLQQLLAGWISRWPEHSLDDVLAVSIWPIAMVVLTARLWPKPRPFMVLLAGYHLAEWLWHGWSHHPCLLTKLLEGRLVYLLLLGLEILLGMGVMLLPDKRAAGNIPRPPSL